MQPSVLIMCERAAERETIRVLVGTMGCQWVLASSIEEALAMLSRERISAALLELPGAVPRTVSGPSHGSDGRHAYPCHK